MNNIKQEKCRRSIEVIRARIKNLPDPQTREILDDMAEVLEGICEVNKEKNSSE